MKTKKVKPKALSYYKERAWKIFSEYVRRKHSDAEGYSRCYTCEVVAHWKNLQCGHAIPGRNNAVLLDDSICRPQCCLCNVFKHGQLHIFATKLQLENGQDWWMQKLADSNRAVKVGRAEYEVIIEDLKKKVEELCQ